MNLIEPSRIIELKARVKAECARRKYVGSVAEYSEAGYDFIETPIVDVKITDNGLKVDLTIKDQSDKQLKLVKTDNGLDTSFTWDDGNNILFKCLTYDEYHSMPRHDLGKIYFITDEMCIYLNEVRYGDNLSLVDTDTIEITNIGNSVRLGVKIDPDEYNLLSKSSAGLAAQIYWEE